MFEDGSLVRERRHTERSEAPGLNTGGGLSGAGMHALLLLLLSGGGRGRDERLVVSFHFRV